MERRSWSKTAFGLLAFACAFAISAINARSMTAHDYSTPYRWYSTSATFQTFNAGTYRTTIQSAAGDYDANTDLTVSHTSTNSGGYGYIQFYESNYGAAWTGRAEPYNSLNQACWTNDSTLTGFCTTSGTTRAYYAFIYFDLSDAIGTGDYSKKLPRHEAGHVFGLNHGDCAEVSVMKKGTCSGTQYPTLQTHDKDFINTNY